MSGGRTCQQGPHDSTTESLPSVLRHDVDKVYQRGPLSTYESACDRRDYAAVAPHEVGYILLARGVFASKVGQRRFATLTGSMSPY